MAGNENDDDEIRYSFQLHPFFSFGFSLISCILFIVAFSVQKTMCTRAIYFYLGYAKAAQLY